MDGDGLPEIVTSNGGAHMLIFNHDGSLQSQEMLPIAVQQRVSIALADVDNDGDVEIQLDKGLFTHTGATLWMATGDTVEQASPSVLADLDGDGDQEVIFGHSAYHHDGSLYYHQETIDKGFPQVADLDGDMLPEVLVANREGLSLLEHDGTLTQYNVRFNSDPAESFNWIKPATIHNFDSDSQPEVAVSSASHFSIVETDLSTVLWEVDVSEPSCCAGGTAFDFLGDSTAEALYADEHQLYALDPSGNQVLSPQPARSSWTWIEYPVVADIDNDGSAEVLVVSSEVYGEQNSPTLQAIRDADDRWIAARRIWNQHTYHVTNVREDGTIPQFEQPHWLQLNTFRTQAQITGEASVCQPPAQ